MGQAKAGRTVVSATLDGSGRECGSERLGAYLRRLRAGYGYTLRKVQERALSFGESIDNSQLSRFEKGKAVPSFDKLRALARIFNVSVQSFSDVLDLEQYEELKPTSRDYDELLRDGAACVARGDHGRAFVTFERALEVIQSRGRRRQDTASKIVEARWRMATALRVLGKLALAEHELREILKLRSSMPGPARIRTLLQLGFVYSELGDRYLASVLARECLELAIQEGDLKAQASVLNALANIHFHDGEPRRALAYYRRAMEVLDTLGGHDEMRTTLLINLGGCEVALHSFDTGVGHINEAHRRALERGYRRAAALALTRLGEAHLRRGDHEGARKEFAESDSLSSRPEGSYHDILFLNAFHCWELARQEGNATREKIAFGRLRHLRSLLERRFPEVDAFDQFVERTRRRYA